MHGDKIDITAVVTVTDDGGSSGKLRRHLDVPPPGDIRNCLVALSEDEALLSRLFQFRFGRGPGLKGHSFGNLFLTALTQMTGDFAKAVRLAGEVLASGGHIYPSTSSNVTLEATLVNGRTVSGETRITRSRVDIDRIAVKPCDCRPLKETLEAIECADLITFGPGSLYTSVVPNLLVRGMTAAIRRSAAMKVYILNLMWQPWETMHYKASDHVAAMERHGGDRMLDAVVFNTRPIEGERRRRYARDKVFPVEVDGPWIAARGLRMIGRNLLAPGPMVRHDPDTLAGVLVELAKEARLRRTKARTTD